MNNIRSIMITLVCLTLLATSVYAAPHLLVSEKTLQFRKVTPGQQVSKELSLTNTGDEQLEVGKIRTSCSCIQADCPLKLIAPGKSVPIKITFDSKGKSAGQGYYQLLILLQRPETEDRPSTYTHRYHKKRQGISDNTGTA